MCNTAKNANIILLTGQSNAVGVGFVKHLYDHFPKEQVQTYIDGYPKIRINYNSHDKESGGFVTTTVHCTEVNKYTIGPEVGIAQALQEADPDAEWFIIKCAFGGTSMYHDWLSPTGRTFAGAAIDERTGWCWAAFEKLLAESMEILRAQGYAPSIRAFCWMQGESDADTMEHVRAYRANYDAMLCDLRALYGDLMEDCVYVDAGISEIWNLWQEINAIKAAYAAEADNRVYLDTVAAGLTTKNEPVEEPDIAHYDSDCVIRLGQMFAEAFLGKNA